MRISREIGVGVPVATRCACKHDFRQISRDSVTSVDTFTRSLTNLVVGYALAGDSRKRNVISRFAAKIQARRISAIDFEEWTKKANPQPFDMVLSRRCNPGETAFV